MSAGVVCLRPAADFAEVGVAVPADLRVHFAAGPGEVPAAELATARAVVLASVGPRLELVQFTGAGVDRLGDGCAHRPAVAVANVPAANAREVAEYVLFAAGTLLRRLAYADREIRAGRYPQARAGLSPGAVASLHSRTAGVIGLGHIGLAVARLLTAVGASVVYADPAPADPEAARALGLTRLDLDDLLARCDLVTVHVPLLPGTRGLIGEERLRRLPRGAVLISAARGGVVDEQALARALASGHLGGAAVDVYAEEPPPAQGPLFTLPPEAAGRVLFTPHIAGVAREAAQRLYTEAWANVHRVLAEGRPARHRILP